MVTLHSVDENTDRSTTSDDAGSFVFENLKPGSYTPSISHQGFSTTKLYGISLASRQALRVSAAMSIAAEATTVKVTSTADQIDTENAAISDSKNNLMITELTLNNRAVTASPLGSLTLSASVQQDIQGNIALDGQARR